MSYIDSDEKEKIIDNYYEEIIKYLPEKHVVVLNDDTDINKEYSKKIEDLCVVRDASSQTEKYVNGYHLCEYVTLTEKEKSPISLYSKIYSPISNDFKSENDETIKGEDKVKEILNKYNKKPIFIRDRGYDANEFFKKDINEDNKFVTRLKGNRHLLFKGKKRLVEEVARSRKGKISTKLMYRGENKECSISYTISEEGTMMILTNNKETAEYIARLYFLRWRIEEYFNLKKEYNWENSLLRSLESMNNLNMFLTITLTFVSVLVEKKDKNFYSNLILERACSLKDKAIIYMGMMVSGIKEILRYARTGIKEWQHIESRSEYKQIQLKI